MYDGCLLALLLTMWYGSSVLTSLSTKEILRGFPHPVTLALVQQAIAIVCSWSSLPPGSRRLMAGDTQLHYYTLQVSAVMVVALVSYRWSLMGASVAFVHTVKTVNPVFTIAFSRALLGERLAMARYFAVLPIILGVALTSVSGAETTVVGFVAAGLSTSAAALQAVVAKRLLRDGDISKSQLFAMAALQAFLLLLPLALVLDARHLPTLSYADTLRLGRLLLLNGLCSYANQYVALSVLDLMRTPLSYALANVMKRATVIMIAMAYAAKPVTPLHLCGVTLSLVGALGYQQVGIRFPQDSRDGDGSTAQYELLPLHERSFPQQLPPKLEVAACGLDCVTESAESSESGDAESQSSSQSQSARSQNKS